LLKYCVLRNAAVNSEVCCGVCRLRHERQKPGKIEHGGPCEYQLLRCHDLDKMPQPEVPRHLRRVYNDAFDKFIDSGIND